MASGRSSPIESVSSSAPNTRRTATTENRLPERRAGFETPGKAAGPGDALAERAASRAGGVDGELENRISCSVLGRAGGTVRMSGVFPAGPSLLLAVRPEYHGAH